ncbi:hypothetical protein [Jatrophihabitans sp.]|uniref:CASTOR/POLLUX-related putative ion channel n=1 Tax=Jatrophihabitans sp. TaxID=1932789 RepID=UPI0030C686CF|nr:hypothetical protein [Jatrophihabitans sp.]
MQHEMRRRTAAKTTTMDSTGGSRRPIGFGSKLRYRFDLALARGPLVVIGYLGLVMLAIILIAATLLTIFKLTGINGGSGKLSFPEAFWQSVIRVVDSGGEDGDQRWPTRIISLLVTLSGIFLAGSLIGLIATAVDQQISELRKGRSAVLETGHTLVLGWSPRLPTILSELVIANENHKKQAFVVLADRAKDEMEDELRRLVPDTKTTRVVCRTGDPGSVEDLHLVNVTGARSVIVLAGEEGDAAVVKSVLAVRSVDPTFERIRVVAELESIEHAETLRSLTDNRIATVQADRVISQVTAQACHQAGLAGVFRDLLDFDGDEIYFTAVPELAGHTYAQVALAFEKSAVMGVFSDGVVNLNPPADYVFAVGEELIAIAEDDDAVIFSGWRDETDIVLSDGIAYEEPPQRIAVVGWSSLGAAVIEELDQFLTDGSIVDVIVDRNVFTAADVIVPEHHHCEVVVHEVTPGAVSLVGVITGHDYDQAIVLGYRRTMNASQADARTMLTLLALNKAWADSPRRPRLVAEMLDRANVDIAQTTGVDDFIVSDELSSLMIAQVSERLDLQDVFRELFDVEGCFVSLRPAPTYAPAHATTYASIVASAAARGESALGYRQGSGDVCLNPAKSTELHLGAGDRVLVLAPRSPR